MQLPSEWNPHQLVIDLYATLEDATDRELNRIPWNIWLNKETEEELHVLWTHLHASAFLLMSFSIIEGYLGRRAWEKHSSLPRKEYRVLYCIRNAIVHTNGHLCGVHDYKLGDGQRIKALCLVRDFEVKMQSDKDFLNSLSIAKPYYYLRDDDVVLTSSSFGRILYLVESLLKVSDHSDQN